MSHGAWHHTTIEHFSGLMLRVGHCSIVKDLMILAPILLAFTSQ